MNIILKGQILKAFPLRSRTRQDAYFHHSEVKLFANDIILYIENSKDYTHTQLLEPINEFSKIAGYNVNTQKSVAFIYRITEHSEWNLEKQLTISSKE